MVQSTEDTDYERTPLLNSTEVQENIISANEDATFGGGANQQKPSKSFNLAQVLLLCAIGLAEPLAMFCIFPFINSMIFNSGNVQESDVGFWSGLIESLFAIVEMSVMVLYGRTADRIGRKPVVIFSLTGMGIAISAFGFSKTIWQMVGFRCLGGFFAGSGGILRALISENCDKAGEAKAFGWYMFANNLGMFLAPLVGGLLARPADVYPGIFGNSRFFHEFPYALPTMFAGALCLLAALISALFLQETLNRDPSVKEQSEAPSMWKILNAPGVGAVLVISGHIMFQAVGFQSTILVAWFTSINLGGFSFSERHIAIFLLVISSSQAVYMLLVFPVLQRRYGTAGVLWGCAIAWPFAFATFPILNAVLRNGWETIFWTCAGIIWPISSGVMMALVCVQLCVRKVSPSSQTLATTNALVLTINAGVKAVSPVIFTSLWALGARTQWLNGQLGFVVLIVVTALLPITLLWLPDAVKEEDTSKTPDVEHERS